jgi:hypothetical protein
VSWDVLVMVAPDEYETMHDLPMDFEPQPLGEAASLLPRLRERFPSFDVDDTGWGYLAGDGWGMEISIGSNDPIRSIMLYVRGSGGDEVIDVIADLAEVVGGRAMDLSEGIFLKRGSGSASGWQAFQEYRDRVINRP